MLDSWEKSVKDRDGWGKVLRHAVETVFTTLSPFAKNSLSIANNAQSVEIVPISFANPWLDWGDESIRFAVLRSPGSCNCNHTLTIYIDDTLPIRRLQERMTFAKLSTTFANNSSNSISLGKSLKKSHSAIQSRIELWMCAQHVCYTSLRKSDMIALHLGRRVLVPNPLIYKFASHTCVWQERLQPPSLPVMQRSQIRRCISKPPLIDTMKLFTS